MQALVKGAGTALDVELLPQTAVRPAPEETGATMEQNALIKAIEYSRRVPGKLVLADDSGLEVDALDGAPGVHSARYAAIGDPQADPHKNSSDEANNAKLLRELENLPDAQRTARFVCVLALAKNGEIVETARGIVEGRIAHHAKGKHGFGYDPLFLVPELGVTLGEVATGKKGEYSHRGKAFRKLLESLVSGDRLVAQPPPR